MNYACWGALMVDMRFASPQTARNSSQARFLNLETQRFRNVEMTQNIRLPRGIDMDGVYMASAAERNLSNLDTSWIQPML